jgi:hypothetical protein
VQAAPASVPCVVRMWSMVLCRSSRWIPVGVVSSENSFKRLWACLLRWFSNDTDGVAMSPDADKDVTPSSRRLFLHSTRSQ